MRVLLIFFHVCVMQNVRYIRDVRAVAKAKGPTVDEVCTLWHVRINKPSMMHHFERTIIKDVSCTSYAFSVI